MTPPRRDRSRLRRSNRRGATLVLFAMMLFGVIALACLVIDMGSLLAARRQLQSAVNAAAIEGLRLRDGLPPQWQSPDSVPAQAYVAAGYGFPETAYSPSDTEWQSYFNFARRWAAANAASQVLTSNSLTADGEPFYAMQAPTFTGGLPLGEFTVAQTVNVTGTSLQQYQPDLLPNLGDADQGGDMVAGQYLGSRDYATTADPAHTEGDDYSRTDYSPATGNSAFLVRMRRTNEEATSTRSAWVPVPSLFNGVTMLDTANPAGGYPVRGTAIADARPAIIAGPAYPAGMFLASSTQSAAIYGLTPFAIAASQWPVTSGTYNVDVYGNINSTNIAQPTTVGLIIATSSLASGADADSNEFSVASVAGFPMTTPFLVLIDLELAEVTAIASNGANYTWTVARGVGGTQATTHSATAPITLNSAVPIGADVATGAASQLQTGNQPVALANLAVLGGSNQNVVSGYAPIYDASGDDESGRVIGFGFVQWSVPNWSRIAGYQLSISPATSGTVAEQNASAAAPNGSIHAARQWAVGLNPSDWQQLYEYNQNLSGPLLAPALVRSVGLPPPPASLMGP